MPIDGSRKRILSLILCGIAIAGCSEKRETAKPSGQIVATVNGTELTYLQLNHLLQTTGADPSKDGVKRGAVDALIEHELLVQEALEAKLDRDAEVVQAIEAARRQILIDAYAQRMVFPPTPISDAEKTAYFNDHPELFEQRRVYDLSVFTVKSTELTQVVMTALETAKTPAATRQVLDQARMHYSERNGEQSAEQLPLGLVKQFAAAETGDILASPQAGDTNLMQITALQTKPVAFAEAAPMIDQYLTGVRNRDALVARVKQLRERAQIAVADEFGGDSGVAVSTAR